LNLLLGFFSVSLVLLFLHLAQYLFLVLTTVAVLVDNIGLQLAKVLFEEWAVGGATWKPRALC
jgi:hypothetical protein